ncbi:MAG TPA: hypothetical protein VLE74_03115 [Candidatus Saccharimonadales bacterium]|nr:hypothetical protein [Candidatus Saccharimonadales bacterium]
MDRYVRRSLTLIRTGGRVFVLLAAATAILLMPIFLGRARAAQMTVRSLTISSAITSASSVTYTYGFKLGTAGQVQSLKFQACTTALSTCTAPPGLTVASRTFGSQTGWTGATNFAVSTSNTNDCDGTSTTIICLNRTDATSENTTTGKTVVMNGITNPSTANSTFFMRMTTYSTNNFTVGGTVDTGTIASAVVATLIISATVAEVLNFCVGTTSVDDATANPGNDCSNISGTTVNLGILDSSTITTTPVAAGTGGNAVNGIAMLRTNANSGATVSYRAIQQSGTNHAGSLRVVGASCNAGNINTDQCFTSAGTTQTTFTAGVEKFGMTTAGVNCGSTTAYTCTFSTGGYNLTRDGNYDGTGANTYGTTQGFAWDEGPATDQIASSSGSVDDEALVLKFAATPNIVTPTGSYQAQADFIVIATY